ncbi:disease resistance protein RGA2-like [Coffea arabica]|uniref:Disease resistance protein RGA2-like n=1 Tax=Coffea arabica TaxID=13443 RepID=A0A6P6WYX3_COFAR|nr:putative disease resistance protein RGA3 [Coffea arabica]
MADNVASPLLQRLSDRLYTLAPVTNKEIFRNLRLTLPRVHTLVQEAEMHSEDNETLKLWITEIKNTAYEADDIFDEYNLRMMRHKPPGIFSLFFFFKDLIYGFKLGSKLEKIEKNLDSLLKRSAEFGRFTNACTLKGAAEENYSSHVHGVQRLSSSFMIDSEVVGRESDKEYILSVLFKSSDENQLTVIPIVGMGGVGKTTLAQLIYNDEGVSEYFDLQMWVSVGEDFDFIKIAQAIIEQINHEAKNLSNLEVLQETLCRSILGKRFLLVLDDVWNDDSWKWSMISRGFLGAGLGSAVIITTRNMMVARLSGSIPPHYLGPLDEKDSWSLFTRVAFKSIPDPENQELEDIGRRIVQRCGGLPLAIKSLAGLMRSKRKANEWLSFMEENMGNLPEIENHFFPILKLSYNHLPSHLKQCFAYCSIFPKNQRINREKLIQLWIAEGFVRSGKISRRPEDAANEYFVELLERSFFMEITKDEFGEIQECGMHDLMHDLAQSVASVGCSIVEAEDSQDVPKELRYSSLVGKSKTSTVPESLNEATNLRTLLLLSCKFDSIPKLLLNLACLRVLDLSQSGIRKLSAAIGNLKHLRYLNLSHTHIKTLPETISQLRNLQTLELVECYDLHEVPRAICELTNLRNLDFQSCPLLTSLPFGIGKLKFLQRLPIFLVSDKNGSADLSDLQSLELRERLEIKNLEYVKSAADASKAKLHEKVGLSSLTLSWGEDTDSVTTKILDHILENLKPPPQLKVLEIIGFKGHTFPTWLRNQDLPNLVKLSLANCSCRELPPLGDLPYLNDLSIKGMTEVHSIGDEFYGHGDSSSFPSLKQLELFDMPNLSEWKCRGKDKLFRFSSVQESSSNWYNQSFACLETLTVMGCSKLINLPSLPYLKSLALWNSNEQLLGSISNLTSLSSLLVYKFRLFREPEFQQAEAGFSSVTTLTIYDCGDLISRLNEGIRGFTSLKHLHVLYCDRLESLPPGVGYLTTLQKLSIADCQDLAYFPDTMSNLSSLIEMKIEACPLLKSLPLGMLQLPSLPKFVIQECPNLEKFLRTSASVVC